MHIELWPIDRPIPYARNARKLSRLAVDKVAASLKEFGWQQPLVVDAEGVLIVGHTRLLAAKQLGMTEVPVLVAAHLTPGQVKAYRLMDNRSHQETDWDMELLGPEFGDLKALNFDLSLTGFESNEIDVLTLDPVGDAADECPELPENPVSQLGDLWLLGPHRVLCGDSTNATDVTILLAGALQPFLMVTDPPYGVEYDPTWRDGKGGFSTAAVKQRGKVMNDDRADWTEAYALFPGSVAYVWHASLCSIEVGTSVLAAGFGIRGIIIWRKQQPLFGQGHYHWQHEPCWYAVRKGQTAHWHGDRKQSTVWDIQNLNPTGNRNGERVRHGTQKPVECMRRPVLNHTQRGEAVYDPFLGSGTTLIAAELTERVCYGLELDPKYVDVIVQRWEKQSGKEATLDGHGATFTHVKEGRLLGAQDAIKEEAIAGR